MTEHPILFTTEMVRAILEGRKTQTRRVVKPQPTIEDDGFPNTHRKGEVCLSKWTGYPLIIEYRPRLGYITMPLKCPYGDKDDHLWVREKFTVNGERTYYATEDDGSVYCAYTPSIHMPRNRSRITVEVVNVRVERVQDISENNAKAEGIREYTAQVGKHSNPTPVFPAFPERDGGFSTARAAFEVLWDSINSKRGYGWDTNPLVWVIEFKRI